jgi:hypothetical protein
LVFIASSDFSLTSFRAKSRRPADKKAGGEEMSEFALALWAMTAVRHQWPAAPQAQPPQPPPVRIETAAPNDPERRRLRQALEQYRKRVTGNLVLDREAGLYVPEVKEPRRR